MTSQTQSTTEHKPITVYAAIVSNLIIAIAKFVVAALTGSSAMLSEGIHSIADTGNQILLLIGIHRGRRPADATHPFGHGKELYFWSLIVAIILFGIGGGMSVYEGIMHIQHPTELDDATWNYVVLVIAFIAEGTSWTIAFRHLLRTKAEGKSIWHTVRHSKNPEIYIVLGEDRAALIGIVIAFCGIGLSHIFNRPEIDGTSSVAIGIVLVMVAIFLAIESRSLIVGESADAATVKGVYDLVNSDHAISGLQSPLTMHLGPQEVLLTMDVTFIPELSGTELAETIERLEQKIRKSYPEIKYIYIEGDAIKRKLRN
jgi:cation diffusion facilitator family transporter